MTVAAYVRVSTQRQAQAQTIEQQLERLRAHLRGQGLELTSESIFRDDGCSGATLNRPGLDRLRDAVRAGEVTQVLVTDPDRLARNYVKLMVLLEELERAGCEVTFLDRPMGRDPQDQLMLQIRGAVAEYERTLIAERMRRGRQAKLRAGCLLPWSRAPYGYRLDPDRPRDPVGVTIEPAEAAVVQELFASYLEEHGSLYRLAKHLQEIGIVSPDGRPRWRANSLRGILTNPTYTGQVYAGRWRSRAPCRRRSATRPIGKLSDSPVPVPATAWLPVASIPALVSEEQLAQVQAKLAQNRAFAARHNTAHAYLLRALVSCGVCRSSCTGRLIHPSYAYYVCRSKAGGVRDPGVTACRARYAPAAQLDALVWQDLCALLTHPDQIAQALTRAHGGGWLPQELQARREQLRRGRLGLERQLERLTEAYLLAVLPLAEYQRRRQALEQKLEALRAQASQLEAKVDRQAEIVGWAASAATFCERVRAGLASANFAQKRQLVELLIDRVLVSDDVVEIRYVIPLSPDSEKVRFCHLRKDYFDPVALTICFTIEPRLPLLIALARDHRHDAAPTQPAPSGGAAVALVAGHPPRPQPGAAPAWPADSTLVEQRFQRDLLVALAAGQHRRDRLAAALGAQVHLRGEATLRAAQRLTPRRRRSGGRRRRADVRGRWWRRRSAGPSRPRRRHRLWPAARPRSGPTPRSGASGRTGSTPSRPGRSARADRARARRCGAPTGCH
jgi:site-specific DNA recombinase